MPAPNQTPLSITRHTIQLIWQTSLTAHTQAIGLLASQSKGIIDTAVHTPFWQALPNNKCKDVSQVTPLTVAGFEKLAHNWQTKHTYLSGVYQCSQPTTKVMQDTEVFLQPYFQQYEGIPLIHLYLSFNTKGVLESQAWIIQNNQAIQIPLQLTEDRQVATKS